MDVPSPINFDVYEWKRLSRNMAVSDFLATIKAELSPGAKVLSDSRTEEFKLTLQRWSDLNTQTPGAIISVATEDDIVKTVCFFFLSELRTR